MPYKAGTYGEKVTSFIITSKFSQRSDLQVTLTVKTNLTVEKAKNLVEPIIKTAEVDPEPTGSKITINFSNPTKNSQLKNNIKALRKLFLPANERHYLNGLILKTSEFASDLSLEIRTATENDFDDDTMGDISRELKQYIRLLNAFKLTFEKDDNKDGYDTTPTDILEEFNTLKEKHKKYASLDKLVEDLKKFAR